MEESICHRIMDLLLSSRLGILIDGQIRDSFTTVFRAQNIERIERLKYSKVEVYKY
jgi:hypothetical protein